MKPTNAWFFRGMVGICTPLMLAQGPTGVSLYAPLFGVTYHATPAVKLVVQETFGAAWSIKKKIVKRFS